MFRGETITTGASDRYPICNKKLTFQVMRSQAGYYIGTSCCEGPYTRETSYFRLRAQAEEALQIYRDTGLLFNRRDE